MAISGSPHVQVHEVGGVRAQQGLAHDVTVQLGDRHGGRPRVADPHQRALDARVVGGERRAARTAELDPAGPDLAGRAGRRGGQHPAHRGRPGLEPLGGRVAQQRLAEHAALEEVEVLLTLELVARAQLLGQR